MHGQWSGNDAPKAGSWQGEGQPTGEDQDAAKDDQDGAKDDEDGAKDDKQSLAIVEAHKAGTFNLRSPLGCLFRREMKGNDGFAACKNSAEKRKFREAWLSTKFAEFRVGCKGVQFRLAPSVGSFGSADSASSA